MNFTFVPSLKHITLVNITTTLWNRDDIRDKIIDSPEYFKNLELRTIVSIKLEMKYIWPVIERLIIEKVSQFSLPDTLKNEITACIRPIRDSIENWIYQIGFLLSDENGELSDKCLVILAKTCTLPNRFFWTPQGMMDQKKTAEVLIKDKRITFSTRYRLACNYCLESDILVLRNKISEYERMDFYSENPRCADRDYFDLVIIWNYDLTSDVGREGRRSWPSRYVRAFECAVIHGNKAATDYFLQKLTREEREDSFINVAPKVPVYSLSPFFSDVLCFLLSQMSAELQMEVFQHVPSALACFLVWPWQNFLLETTYRMKDCFIMHESFLDILHLLFSRNNCYTDYNYKMLLGEFWKQIPNFHKASILNDEMSFIFLLRELLRNEDRINLKLIFKDATPVQSNKYSSNARFILENLKHVKDGDLLKIILEMFVTSEDIAAKYVEVLNQSEVKKRFEENEDVWVKLSESLNELVHKLDRKRSMNEVSDCPAKRLCGNVTH